MASIVLAGGRSRRMGVDKALLRLDGQTLLERAVTVAAAVSAPVFVVADRAHRYSIANATVVADERPGEGPLGGILAGLRAAGAGCHLVVACDMPHLSAPLLTHLLDLCSAETDAVVPRLAGRPEPLCAVYAAAAAARLRAQLDSGERAVHRSLEALRVRWVEEDEIRRFDADLRSVENWNEPGDVARSGL